MKHFLQVTFYLLFAVAGIIFCVVNTVINLLLFCNQNKVGNMSHVVICFIYIPQGILGSWLTWTVLCAIGHLVWSFEQVTFTLVTQ